MWISVHDEVLGAKLRGLKKSIGCSTSEALGIVVQLWLWAKNNTDVTGLLKNSDKSDIAEMLLPTISRSLNPDTVVEKLIENTWLDVVGTELYVHDWSMWQRQWYTYVDRKQKDAVRKRQERNAKPEEKIADMTDEEYQKLKKKYGESIVRRCLEANGQLPEKENDE